MNAYIGYSTDKDIRFQATSGGIGTSLIKWLFEKGYVQTSISFSFNSSTLKYDPKLIYRYEDYEISGSIYQEIDIINFIKNNTHKIKGSFVCFSLPCQTRAIRTIVERNGHSAFIIGLTCSSQLTLEGTKFLLKKIRLKEDEVKLIKYRGDGWPSGIRIDTRSGNHIFLENNSSIWTSIFHSRLFVRKKCLMCSNTLNLHCDIVLADPWLQEYKSSETIGQTMCVCYTNKAYSALNDCFNDGYIHMSPIGYDKVLESQKSTINRKESYAVSCNIINT